MSLLCLGIEGTAHTLGVGIVDEECNVLANRIDMLRPKEGGIHPRVAANHHADVVAGHVAAALEEAKVAPSDIDLVAFSRGPGLGPCLRTAATAARSLALSLDVPLIGVNHCVAHLEIGRATTGCGEPVLLYVSGANTQVIAFARGRYRVFGETLDVGVGNCLDKIGRDLGMPFPAGPAIEKMALSGKRLLEMPYSVKGMDVAFSGMLTSAASLVAKGERVEDVAYSVQETAFAMLTEVTERALAHIEYDEVLLGGGVARNRRLRSMIETMCGERGARYYVPKDDLCVDNGAMIAWLGLLAHKSGVRNSLAETVVDQRFRTDDVEVTWRPRGGDTEERVTRAAAIREGETIAMGGEAVVVVGESPGTPLVLKKRVVKSYRHPEIDRRLRRERTRLEARLLHEARLAGVRTPIVYDVDLVAGVITMEFLPGRRMKDVLDTLPARRAGLLLETAGESVAKIHSRGLIHGDLTTSNMLVDADEVALIDFGLGCFSEEVEDMGTDIHVLMESLTASHGIDGGFERFMAGYAESKRAKEIRQKLGEILKRGRYKGGG